MLCFLLMQIMVQMELGKQRKSTLIFPLGLKPEILRGLYSMLLGFAPCLCSLMIDWYLLDLGFASTNTII